jgi:hypothetical protein
MNLEIPDLKITDLKIGDKVKVENGTNRTLILGTVSLISENIRDGFAGIDYIDTKGVERWAYIGQVHKHETTVEDIINIIESADSVEIDDEHFVRHFNFDGVCLEINPCIDDESEIYISNITEEIVVEKSMSLVGNVIHAHNVGGADVTLKFFKVTEI